MAEYQDHSHDAAGRALRRARRTRRVNRLGIRAAVTFGILLAAAPAASAAETAVLPQDFPAADQYVESVPTSSGPKPAKQRPSDGPSAGANLPPAVKNLDAPLREVAISPALGAPQRKLRHAQVDKPSVPSAAVSAVGDSDGGRLVWLLLALALTTGAVTGTAAHRHYARRTSNAR
jgi:hypothetical protein